MIIFVSIGVSTAVNASVSRVSRSRVKKWIRCFASSRSVARLRACWASRSPVG
jgi:hypothetical protein